MSRIIEPVALGVMSKYRSVTSSSFITVTGKDGASISTRLKSERAQAANIRDKANRKKVIASLDKGIRACRDLPHSRTGYGMMIGQCV